MSVSAVLFKVFTKGLVKSLLCNKNARIQEGPYQNPTALRHGFGVLAILKSTSFENMLPKWMSYICLERAAICANILSKERRNSATKGMVIEEFWSNRHQIFYVYNLVFK